MVGVYTGAAVQDGRLGAMHMERVPARAISRCKDLKMDISTGVAQWRLTAVPTGSTLPMVVGPAPVVTSPPAVWVVPTGGAMWLGSAANAKQGNYIYELTFCLCWTFQNAQINLRLWADNQADLLLNGSPTTPSSTIPSTAYLDPPMSVAITTGFKIGMNTLTVNVTNNEGPTGLLVSGTLSANAADCNS